MSLIRVFEIPPAEHMAKDYLFQSAYQVTFKQVDWFRDDAFPLNDENHNAYVEFIEKKNYAKAAESRGAALLILGPDHTLTINYRAP